MTMTTPTALTVSRTNDRYQQSRKLTRRDRHGMPPRWRYVLELHLSGHLPTKTRFKTHVDENGVLQKEVYKHSIKELTGYSPAMIHRILAKPEVLGLKQQIMNYYDEEFKALYPQVVNAVRKGLDSDDKYLDAAKLYLKEFGKPQQQQGSINVTAEDVVFNILQTSSPRAKPVMEVSE